MLSTSRLFQLFHTDEVGPLEIVDVRMVGGEAAGRATKAVAIQGEIVARYFRSSRALRQRSGDSTIAFRIWARDS